MAVTWPPIFVTRHVSFPSFTAGSKYLPFEKGLISNIDMS